MQYISLVSKWFGNNSVEIDLNVSQNRLRLIRTLSKKYIFDQNSLP